MSALETITKVYLELCKDFPQKLPYHEISSKRGELLIGNVIETFIENYEGHSTTDQFPDHTLDDVVIEVKLKDSDKNSPNHVNFNSHIPSGKYQNKDVFYVFIGHFEFQVSTIVVLHGDVYNAYEDSIKLEDKYHLPMEHGLGTNGLLTRRPRDMWESKAPWGIDKSLKGKCSLLLPEDWPHDDHQIQKTKTIVLLNSNCNVFESTLLEHAIESCS